MAHRSFLDALATALLALALCVQPALAASAATRACPPDRGHSCCCEVPTRPLPSCCAERAPVPAEQGEHARRCDCRSTPAAPERPVEGARPETAAAERALARWVADGAALARSGASVPPVVAGPRPASPDRAPPGRAARPTASRWIAERELRTRFAWLATARL